MVSDGAPAAAGGEVYCAMIRARLGWMLYTDATFGKVGPSIGPSVFDSTYDAACAAGLVGLLGGDGACSFGEASFKPAYSS